MREGVLYAPEFYQETSWHAVPQTYIDFYLVTIRRNDFICTGSIMLYMKELIIYFCHSSVGNFPSSTLIRRNTNIHFNF